MTIAGMTKFCRDKKANTRLAFLFAVPGSDAVYLLR